MQPKRWPDRLLALNANGLHEVTGGIVQLLSGQSLIKGSTESRTGRRAEAAVCQCA
jgi:hypothetical protein